MVCATVALAVAAVYPRAEPAVPSRAAIPSLYRVRGGDLACIAVAQQAAMGARAIVSHALSVSLSSIAPAHTHVVPADEGADSEHRLPVQ